MKEILMNFISPVFYQVLYMTVIGSIVGILVYFIRNIFDKKMSGKSKCVLWSIVLITLLIPVRFEVKSNYSILENNFVDRVENIKYVSNYEHSENDEVLNNNDILNNSNKEPLTEIEYTENNINNENTYKMPLEVKIKNIVIPTVWLLGSALLILTFYNTTRSIRKKTSKKIYKDERIESILNQCKNQLNIKCNVSIVLQKYKRVPSIFGILNPSILITKELLQEDDQTIRYIFLHELSHYKRKDMLLNYILLLVLSVHWFNPVVWFLFNKIRQDIEIGADELASKGLTKAEKKEYGMVLINSLRNQAEENYATNLLCMSDTEKNMERRIVMLKGKSKSIFLSMVIITIILAIVVSIVFIKQQTVEENKTTGGENIDNTIQQDNILENTENKNIIDNSLNNNENIEENERIAMEKYIYNICNNTLNERLSEFDDINDADKNWIYSHIKSVDDPYYVTKEQIEEQLKKLFGKKLNIDIENDIKNIDDLVLSKSEVYGITGKYALPVYGMDNSTYYTIDKIIKQNEQYVVKVIEFNSSYDMVNDEEGKETIISTYDESIDHPFKWKKVFTVETEKIEKSTDKYLPSITLSQEVLKRKDEFHSYDITIQKNEEELFNLIKIEKDK